MEYLTEKRLTNFIFILVTLIAGTGNLMANTHVIKPGQRIQSTLQKALPGDTVIILKGKYSQGNIQIDKPLVILGKGLPVLDGKTQCEVISVKANRVVIRGLHLINSGYSDLEDMAGIRIYGNSYVTISDNVLDNNFFGIYLTNASHCIVRNNRITGPDRNQNNVGNGIHLWKSAHNRILNNTIKNHRDGIYFEFVKHSLIACNYSEGNQRYGLHFMFSDSDTYYKNTFYNNGAGVAVMYSRDVYMLKNNFNHNWGSSAYGLLLKDIRDSRVLNNRFDKNTSAIFLDGCSRSRFYRNEFYNNGYALRMQANCDDNIFTFNSFRSNSFDYATNGFTILNTLAYNYWDKYTGYDLKRDGIGDLPYRPMNMLTGVIEEYPTAIILMDSFLARLLDVLEKIIPSLTPENLKDDFPLMKPAA